MSCGVATITIPILNQCRVEKIDLKFVVVLSGEAGKERICSAIFYGGTWMRQRESEHAQGEVSKEISYPQRGDMICSVLFPCLPYPLEYKVYP